MHINPKLVIGVPINSSYSNLVATYKYLMMILEEGVSWKSYYFWSYTCKYDIYDNKKHPFPIKGLSHSNDILEEVHLSARSS